MRWNEQAAMGFGNTVALLAVLLSASAAKADWQYTTWGMTPDQVVAASGGKAAWTDQVDHKGKPYRSLRARHPVGSIPAEAAFGVPNGKLVAVVLSIPRSRAHCDTINNMLRGQYGPPFTEGQSLSGISPQWRVPEQNLWVKFSYSYPDYCYIVYEPAAEAGRGPL